MRRRHTFLMTVALLLTILVSACARPTTPVPAQPTPAPVQPTKPPTVQPTAMPQPTQTPEPTDAPEPTAESASTPEASAGSGGTEAKFADFDPGNFDRSTNIDNEWSPMKPGMQWVLAGTTIEEGNSIPRRIEFTVTDLTKEIAGVQTIVAWIVDYRDDEVAEKEIAFYAQDKDRTLWYLGEYPEVYENGEFVEARPWIHGLEDARAGIKMTIDPQPGTPDYYQGWGPAVDWSDFGHVDQIGQEVCVPVDCYKDVLVFAESSLGEVDAFQLKYYARGVGNIRVGWRGADATKEDLEMTEFTQLDAKALAEIRAEALALEKHAYEISTDVYAQTLPAK
ncbi:MAG: hypothetical protein HY870_14180 [Chloroflexi bacterium]|nr:hypothetical protein [Chloroflexota bacterium]